MTAKTAPKLNDEQRGTLAALGDQLVPEAEGMPSASGAEVHGVWIDRVLEVRPDLAEPLIKVLDSARGKDPMEEIRRWNSESPQDLATVGLAVTGAYYLNPRIRQAIQYPGQERNPPFPDEADYFLRDGLLDPVLARPAIYRPTP
jgi:hypothetical protein